MSFAPNHQVILDEAKVFLNKVYDKTPFVNNLDFQGSNDNFVTFTTIKTFGRKEFVNQTDRRWPDRDGPKGGQTEINKKEKSE